MLPRPLGVMVGIFLLMPLTSWAVHGTPWELYSREGIYRVLVVLAGYWLAPWLLVGAILLRRFLFFPFYLFQCALLGVHCYVFGQSLPWDLLVVRYILVACMAYLGVLLTNRDFLFPFLSKSGRAWRKARRYDVNVGLQLLFDGHDERVEALMENCSSTGIGIKIAKEHFHGNIKKLRRGHKLGVNLDWTRLNKALPVEVVWIYEYQNYWTLGLRVLDTDSMMHFVAEVVGIQDNGRPLHNSHLQLLETDVRQTAFVLWIVFIMLSFSIPLFA